jgi:cysteine desulfurase
LIDLDHNATTPLHPAVRATLAELLAAGVGNPSSVHGRGQAARAIVDRARAQVAQALDVHPAEIVFTSGATEANILAWRGILRPGDAAVTTEVEHPSVLAIARQLEIEGVRVQRVGVDPCGRLDLAGLERALEQPGVRLTSVMAVNNELGTRLPIEIVAGLARAHGSLVHADVTQAIGRIPMDLRGLGLDLASLSGHKLGAPSGVGMLWLRRGVPLRAVQGGHQEHGLRAGTENLLGIAGLGAAMAVLGERLAHAGHVRSLRDRLWEGLQAVAGVRRHGAVGPLEETGNTLTISIDGVAGPALLMALDLEDVYASSGAACSSGSLEPSHVLQALGVPIEQARGAIRFSFGPDNSEAEVARVVTLLPGLVQRIRQAGMTPPRAGL